MDIVERAERYVSSMDGAVSGSGGHDATFKVACALVHGFELSESDALHVMQNTFNPKCSPQWSERDLQHKVRSAANAGAGMKGSGYLLGNSGRSARGDYGSRTQQNAAVRAEAKSKRQPINEDVRQKMLNNASGISALVDLMEISPVDVRDVTSAAGFLDALYDKDDKVLIFTSDKSQGDFGHFCSGSREVPGKSYQLGERPGVDAKRAEIPHTARGGIWFLAQPVSGEWKPNGRKDNAGQPLLSRRSGKNVTAWRYMLLEADDVSPEEWIKVASQLPMAVSAIYTSGGRSVHMLVRVNAANYDHFYSLSQKMGPVVAALGGDSAAISGVRLTRLPFCMREGFYKKGGEYQRYDAPRKQRLLYLNPHPEVKPLAMMKKCRVIDRTLLGGGANE